MTIYFASDHAGFALKQALVPFVRNLGHVVEDCGAHIEDPEDDYPDFIALAASQVSSSPDDTRAIVLGGSGQGEAIVANRFRNVRAIVFNGQYAPEDGRDVPHEIVISREHNNSNVLSLGARFLTEAEAKNAVKTWLETPFPGDHRHVRRIQKIEQYP